MCMTWRSAEMMWIWLRISICWRAYLLTSLAINIWQYTYVVTCRPKYIKIRYDLANLLAKTKWAIFLRYSVLLLLRNSSVPWVVEKGKLYSCMYLPQILTDIRHTFTEILDSKLATKIEPHFKCRVPTWWYAAVRLVAERLMLRRWQ